MVVRLSVAKKLPEATNIGLYLALVMAPFVGFSYFPEFIEGQKALFIRVLLLLTLLGAAFQGRASYKVDRSAACLLMLFLFSTMFSLWKFPANRQSIIALFDRWLPLLMVFVAAVYVPSQRQLWKIIVLVVLVLGGISAYGFFRAYLPANSLFNPHTTVTATFSHANLFAQYAAIVIPLIVGLIMCARQKILLALYFTLLPILLMAFFLTYARAAIFACLVGCSIVLFLAKSVFHSSKQFVFRTSAVIFLVVFCLVVLWKFDKPNPKHDRIMREATHALPIGESSFAGRFALWRQGFESVADHPFVGWGAGRTHDALSSHRLTHDPEGRMNHQDVHQDLLQIAVEFGLSALLIFLAFIARLTQLALRNITNETDPTKKIMTMGLLACVVVFFLLGLVDFPMSRSVPRLYAFVFLGWTIAPRLVEEDEPRRAQGKQAFVQFATVFFFVFLATKITVIDEVHDMMLVKKAFAAFDANQREEAVEICESILWDADTDVGRRASCYGLSRWKLSLPERHRILNQLVQLSPSNYRIAFSRTVLLLNMGRIDEACREIQRGIRLWRQNPLWLVIAEPILQKAEKTGVSMDCQQIRDELQAISNEQKRH